jgi:transposase InsO family protein
LADPLVRSRRIEVLDVLREDASEVPLAEDQHVVSAFASDAPEEALADAVGARRPDRRPDHLDAPRRSDPGEGRTVLGVVVPDQEPRPRSLRRRLAELLLWRWRSAPRSPQRRVSPEAVALIRRMAREDRLWGAERIRGELLKLGIAVGKRTIQRHMRGARPPRRAGQIWASFLRTHGREIWVCDVLQLTGLLFRPVFPFVLVELGSRWVVHVGVTRAPTDAWVAQQLREATPEGVGPRFLAHDHDAKYGSAFARVAAASGIEVIRTPIRAPRANTVCERFLGSVRRECVDHLLILGERHLGGSWPSTSAISTVPGHTRASANARPCRPTPSCHHGGAE